ncbi:SGNH/GDSL hydrolase family protein [Butyrivibrio sp. INlla14]|uniref:SGNH/GDSL hydrolase family protein n=1 Tax=Butyrivibrio sp. INlla14 TaxID=1520808 RepID=UPI00087600A8|nr:SGNH/GDSL hydrolase family protein [Butyrivibrio sp. INlla14]SCY42619.1 Lysophospholipase L1 [Butyrivibrio sp. INlla14]
MNIRVILNRVIQNLEKIKIRLLYFDIYDNGKKYLALENSYERELGDYTPNANKKISKNKQYPAGKILRFIFEGNYFDIAVIYSKRCFIKNMSPKATSALSIFRVDKGKYEKLAEIAPKNPHGLFIQKRVPIDSADPNEIAIFLPSYAKIDRISLVAPKEIKKVSIHRKNILFYGSSITQGCAASATSSSYVSKIAIAMDLNVLNFGFSEGARGERELAEFLALKHADYYVIEYDHNSDEKELTERHLEFYKTIRKENPETPIIIISRLSYGISVSESEARRREEIIKRTIGYGREMGDKALFYINAGSSSIDERRKLLADDRHPNDDGMDYLARQVISILRGWNDKDN